MDGWTFLTNHGHVLVCIASDPEVLLKNIATQVGITERAAQRIVSDLIDAGYIAVTKSGRRNQYTVDNSLHFRHPLEQKLAIGTLLLPLAKPKGPAKSEVSTKLAKRPGAGKAASK